MQADLWRGLKTNDLQVVSTDHCPFCFKGQKDLGRESFAKIPNGMPGIETRLYLLWDGGVRTGRISMNRFVEITSTAPAKIFGLYPHKGTIAVGADADLLVWDGEKEHTPRPRQHAHARRLLALRGQDRPRRPDARAPTPPPTWKSVTRPVSAIAVVAA
jgi:dihydroorotase-like cyclic amidohydrolase